MKATRQSVDHSIQNSDKMWEKMHSDVVLTVRRATARRMCHSRADSSIIKLPSQSSISQQGSRWPWCSRRWAGVQTHTHIYTYRKTQPTNTVAGDHFAITLLGDFQLSLGDLLQVFNQIELVADAQKSHMQWRLECECTPDDTQSTSAPLWHSVHTQTHKYAHSMMKASSSMITHSVPHFDSEKILVLGTILVLFLRITYLVK